MNTSVAVVKVGGSLFLQPNFVSRLQRKIEELAHRLSPVHLVLITGGGPVVDALRAIDRVNPLPKESSHWTAIHFMDMNAQILRSLWPELPCVNVLDELQSRLLLPGTTLFCVEKYLREREPSSGTPLPVGWEVSSDSIAARIAELIGAGELILLKSVSVTSRNWPELASEGVVDAYFPTIANRIGNPTTETL